MGAQTVNGSGKLDACAFTYTGSHFVGWSKTSGGKAEYTDGQTVSSSSDLTLYAVWEQNVYVVRYDANGGSGTMADTSVTYGTNTALRLNTFTRSGYAFAGWYRYRSSDKKWYYTNGTTSGWYEKDKQPAGYELNVILDGQNVAKTSAVHGDVCVFYAVWTEAKDTGVSMKGKKVLFLGSSMIYYGHCVNKGNQGSSDAGYFSQLCKALGESCTVIDCTYGSHSVEDFIGKCADCGSDHLSGIDLSTIDYVFVCQVTEKNNMIDTCKKIMARFPSSKTKFIYMDSTYTYQQNYTSMKNQLSGIKDAGWIISSFGSLCYDVWKGNVKVPGSSLTYNKNTFIINGNDANHPNLLTGYIEAVMCYCAATGKSAVGMPYAFVTDTSINSAFNTKTFISENYTKATTNFDKVLASAVDMKGLQTLIDVTDRKWECGPGQTQCQHEYVKSSTLVFAGCSNTTDDYATVCSKCGKAGTVVSVASSGNKNRVNIMASSLGIASHCTTKGPGVFGYSSIKGTPATYDGSRSISGGTILAWRVSSKTPAYAVDGSAGKTYCGAFAFSFSKTTKIDGFTLFADKNSVIKAFDVVGGVKDGSGNVKWTVLWSSDESSLKWSEYDDTTSYVTADFSLASVDYVMFAVKTLSGTSFNIAEVEIYSPAN